MNQTYSQGILFDGDSWGKLFPLTLTRPVAEIRVGILTIREKWEQWTGIPFGHQTQDYLQGKYPQPSAVGAIHVNGSLTPNRDLLAEIDRLNDGDMLVDGDRILAFRPSGEQTLVDIQRMRKTCRPVQVKCPYIFVESPWHIFQYNGEELVSDFNLIRGDRASGLLSPSNRILEASNMFVEEGAKVEFATLNAASGPIYIGRNAEIMEGALIRGPFALCDGSQVKMGAKIYGPTTIGPGSKAGGEINNSILFAHSNKVHDGYLGNSVLGQWCNIGADTNASNLKNNYEPVKVWDYVTRSFQSTGLQFCGLIMGDYSKCGINTMFNTATVVGICANIFGAGFPRSFVPSFSKGGPAGFRAEGLEKVFQSIERQMSRRSLSLTKEDRDIITYVGEHLDRFTAR